MRKINLDIYLTIIGCIAIVSLVVSRFWVLDKGLIFSDDGWYLTLLRDNPKGSMPVRFFKIFQLGVQNDFYLLRLISYFLQLVSLFVFGCSIYKYQKSLGSNKSLLLCLGVVALGSLGIPSISTPYYVPLNLIFGLLSVSSIIIWVSNRKSIFVLLSSFLASCLFISYFTSLILLPILLLYVILQSNKKKHDAGVFLFGVFLFFIIYSFIESPIEIFKSVTDVAKETVNKGSRDYGVTFLIRWSIKCLFYVFKFFIGGFIYVLVKNTITNRIKNRIILDSCLCSSFLFIVVYIDCLVSPYAITISEMVMSTNQLGMPYFLISVLLFDNKKINITEWLSIFLLSVMPYILSLGTNIPFDVRGKSYTVFLLPIVFCLFEIDKSTLKITLVCYTFFLLSSLFSFGRPNWFGDVPYEQTIPVKTIGINQNIKLSQERINQVKFCEAHIDKEIQCLAHKYTWGIVALIDLKPITYQFYIQDEDILLSTINDYMSTHEKLTIIARINDDDKFAKLFDSNMYLIEKISDYNITIYKIAKQETTTDKL